MKITKMVKNGLNIANNKQMNKIIKFMLREWYTLKTHK